MQKSGSFWGLLFKFKPNPPFRGGRLLLLYKNKAWVNNSPATNKVGPISFSPLIPGSGAGGWLFRRPTNLYNSKGAAFLS